MDSVAIEAAMSVVCLHSQTHRVFLSQHMVALLQQPLPLLALFLSYASQSIDNFVNVGDLEQCQTQKRRMSALVIISAATRLHRRRYPRPTWFIGKILTCTF